MNYHSSTLPESAPPATYWATPQNTPKLTADSVHVWRASLDQPPALVASLRQLLSTDEQSRVDRFHFEKDRRHFTVARACLRTLLGRYLEWPPAEIRFSYSDHGKPALDERLGRQLKFNLAHSGGLALYAFTPAADIGVDLEFIRPDFTGDDVARRFFSATEVAALDRLPAPARHQAFFNCWTRKESFIKAKGLGLSLGLDQFDVSLGPDEPAALLSTRWDRSEARRWSIKTIEVGPGYAGAVAVAAHDWKLSCWEFKPQG
jgi:4'-phosphopantetheinyl transferase